MFLLVNTDNLDGSKILAHRSTVDPNGLLSNIFDNTDIQVETFDIPLLSMEYYFPRKITFQRINQSNDW